MIAACWALLTAVAVQAEGPLDVFLRERCIDCHGGTKPKAGVRIEGLARRAEQESVWIRIHDALAAGLMPPAGEPQPSAEERRTVVGELHERLRKESLARQRTEGRVPFRRLTRSQYEHALQDLLGVPVSVRQLIPEDPTTGGFDTVASGLLFSGEHLVQYQKAAAKAIDAAVPRRTDRPVRVSWTGREWFERVPKGYQKEVTPSAYAKDDLAYLFAQGQTHPFLDPHHDLVVRRTYRVRAVISAHNTGGASIPALFWWDVPRKGDLATVIDVRDAAADRPSVVEFEVTTPDVPGREHILINLRGWSLPPQLNPGEFRKGKTALGTGDLSGPALVLHSLEIRGPIDPWPPAGYRRMFGDLRYEPASIARLKADGKPLPKDDWTQRYPDQFQKDPLVVVSPGPMEDAARLIRAFLPLAFRRPVESALEASFVKFAHERLERGYSFAEAMKETYKAVLCSPHFLCVEESPGELDDHALAARLALFLWSSVPDDALLAAAAAGELSKPGGLRANAERMLQDPRARRFRDDFVDQWLDLRKLHATKPDLAYAEYDEWLLWSMREETRRFFREMLEADRDVLEFVHSDWTFLDARLAKHYGIPGVTSQEMARTPLPSGSRRGGVLGQAAVLKVTANGSATSPVLRGAWVLDRLLGTPPSPPPPDLPPLEPDIRGATTARQQLERHRALPACARCHDQIDPPGFALETYDVIGGWREWYRATGKDAEKAELINYPGLKVGRGLPVERGYRMPNGRAFADVDEYKRILLEDPDRVVRNLVRRLLTYGTGAAPQYADRDDVERLVKEAGGRGRGFRSLLLAVIESRMFRCK